MNVISTQISVSHRPAALSSGTTRKTEAPDLLLRADTFQSGVSLAFRGGLDDVTKDGEVSQSSLQKSLLESDQPLLTLNEKPLKAIEFLTLLDDANKKDRRSLGKLAAGAGGLVSVAFIAFAAGGWLLPVSSLWAVFWLYYAISAAGGGVIGKNVSKPDSIDQNAGDRANMDRAFQTLEQAGLVEKYKDGKYFLTQAAQKIVKEYRQQQNAGSKDGNISIEAKTAITPNTKSFAYTDLPASQRVSVFEALTSTVKGGEISGFQYLEKLQGLEKGASLLTRLFKKGLTEKQVLALLPDNDQAWGRDRLEAFRTLGWLRLESGDDSSGKSAKWFLTNAGRQVIALRDPVYTGVMTPEDLHQVFQTKIERLETEKVVKRQNLKSLRTQYDALVRRIQDLEGNVSKLQAGDASYVPVSDVPVAVQLERAQRELELSRKLVERFNLALDAQTLLVQKETAKIDARVTALLDGQVMVKAKILDHSLADILRQLHGETGVLQDSGDEILLAQLSGNASGSEVDGGSLEVSAEELLQGLGQLEIPQKKNESSKPL